MRGFRLFRIARYLPEREQNAKPQNEQREDKETDHFTELPSNQVQLPLAAFVESDDARHRDLHLMAEGMGNHAAELPRPPVRIRRTVPFQLSAGVSR